MLSCVSGSGTQIRSFQSISPLLDSDMFDASAAGLLFAISLRFCNSGLLLCPCNSVSCVIGSSSTALTNIAFGNSVSTGSSACSWSGLRDRRSGTMSFVPGLYASSILNSDRKHCHLTCRGVSRFRVL